ncbi:serine hydrolase domain-containing protein [Nocardia xishanensis]
MSDVTLSESVEVTATQFGIPGVAVGVLVDGRDVFAYHCVTSLDNPQPVDSDTLFHLGSVTKTYTATALMRLVSEGRVELDAPVRAYLPEPRARRRRRRRPDHRGDPVEPHRVGQRVLAVAGVD